MKGIVILGAGGHGKIVYDICKSANRPVIGFLDGALAPQTKLHGVTILGSDALLEDADFRNAAEFIVAVGSPDLNNKIYARLNALQGVLAQAVIHQSASVSNAVRLGRGTIVNAGAVVNIDTVIGENCIVNTSCAIDHDTTIGDCCQISPGAILTGGVQLGNNIFIGSGAVLLPGVRVGDNSFVGAGEIVKSDVAPGEKINTRN